MSKRSSSSSEAPVSKKHKAIPRPQHDVAVKISLPNATEAVDFYVKAFNAVKRYDLKLPDGNVVHGEFKIGDTIVLYSDANVKNFINGPPTLKGTSAMLCIFCDDVDALFEQAIKAGCKELRPVEDHFYGDRAGMLEDPFGHVWSVETHFKDVSPEELNNLMLKMFEPKQNQQDQNHSANDS